jgi:hypothetical protein
MQEATQVKYLGRDALKQASKPELTPFEVPELGGWLALRPIPLRDQMRLNEIQDPFLRVVHFVRAGIADPETGGPLYADEDEFLEVLDSWSPAVLMGIGQKLHELSGTTPEAVEKLEGNSVPTLTDGSLSTSLGSSV